MSGGWSSLDPARSACSSDEARAWSSGKAWCGMEAANASPVADRIGSEPGAGRCCLQKFSLYETRSVRVLAFTLVAPWLLTIHSFYLLYSS